MTFQPIISMTDEEINITIAEACGWECLAEEDVQSPVGEIVKKITGFPGANKLVGWFTGLGSAGNRHVIPDYCNDLNAMHQALDFLDEELYHVYAHELNKIVNQVRTKAWWDLTAIEVYYVTNATARQRAEAFLLTVKHKEL